MTRTLLVALTLVSGCDLLNGDGDVTETPIDPTCAGEPADLNGDWTISGTGCRQGCVDEKLNSDNVQFSVGQLLLNQTSGGTLALGGAPTFTDAKISLANARVSGACVAFTINETGIGAKASRGLTSYVFDGDVQPGGTIVGTFEFDGPGPCHGNGRFTADKTR